MNKRTVTPFLIVAGFLAVVLSIVNSGKAPRTSFEMPEARLRILTDGDGIVLQTTATGLRNHPISKLPCRTARTMRLRSTGTMAVDETCTDEKGIRFVDRATGSWRVADGRLCLDAGKLDSKPDCWTVEYRNGIFNLLDRQLNAEWTMTAENPRFKNYSDLIETLAAH